MARFAYLLCALFVLSSTRTKTVNAQALGFETAEGFHGSLYASVQFPRGAIFDSAGGDLLVTSKDASKITAFFEENGQVQMVTLVEDTTLDINHGIAFRDGFLYSASRTDVFRWPYTPGQRTPITDAPQTVISNMPFGEHWARSIIFDPEGQLIVAPGHIANVPENADGAKVRRFVLPAELPAGGIDFETGEVFSAGTRNELGLAFDSDGILWGVQNAADNITRADLGGDLTWTNPAEELTKHDQPVGTNYGYPYCWTAFDVVGYQRGDQFAWPLFMADGIHSDDWCRNTSNNMPPTMALPAHYAPTGLTFYDGTGCNSTGAFPCSMTGDAFVAFHGSYIREPPGGYKIARIPIDPTTKLPTGEILDVIYEPNPGSDVCRACFNWEDTRGCEKCFRPANVVFDSNGHMFLTADVSGEIYKVTYEEN